MFGYVPLIVFVHSKTSHKLSLIHAISMVMITAVFGLCLSLLWLEVLNFLNFMGITSGNQWIIRNCDFVLFCFSIKFLSLKCGICLYNNNRNFGKSFTEKTTCGLTACLSTPCRVHILLLRHYAFLFTTEGPMCHQFF